MKKRRSCRVIAVLMLMLIAVMIPFEASAATKTTAKYKSRPANQYVIWMSGTGSYNGCRYEHFITVKTKKAGKKIKLIETKGGNLGIYTYKYKDSERNLPSRIQLVKQYKGSYYSGKIQYWVYQGTSASGSVISKGTSILDHSEYIKLPKANKTYTIKVQFSITKSKPVKYGGAGYAFRYVGENYPRWYLQYDNASFNTPAVKCRITKDTPTDRIALPTYE